MKLRWAAPCLLVLLLGVLVPTASSAQQTDSAQKPVRTRVAGGLEQNYPNPFNPETRIPFSVGDAPTCSSPSRTYRVTLKVYNLLAQLVAIPIMQGGPKGGETLENQVLPCGQYVAYWNGKYQGTEREVASGVYLYRLEIDGRSVSKKMIVAK